MRFAYGVAENTAALVQSCTTEQQRATLAETGVVDFISEYSGGKYHAYIYAQESGYLIVTISLHVDAYLQQGVDCRCSDIHLPAACAPSWRRFGTLRPIWDGAPILTKEDAEILVGSFLTEKEWDRLREVGDVDFAYENTVVPPLYLSVWAIISVSVSSTAPC